MCRLGKSCTFHSIFIFCCFGLFSCIHNFRLFIIPWHKSCLVHLLWYWKRTSCTPYIVYVSCLCIFIRVIHWCSFSCWNAFIFPGSFILTLSHLFFVKHSFIFARFVLLYGIAQELKTGYLKKPIIGVHILPKNLFFHMISV